MLTRNFQQMNGKSHDFPWTTVSRYLNAAGVGLSDPRRSFLQQLFHRRHKITILIHSGHRTALQAIIGDVLNHWRKEMRSAGIDSQAVEYTLGLTPEEYTGSVRSKG